MSPAPVGEPFRAWRADVGRYRELDAETPLPLLLLEHQGIWALACHRFGHWAHAQRRSAWPLRALWFVWNKAIETSTGISINPHARIAPGLYIGHFGGIIVGGGVRIGERCAISQGVTLGADVRDGVAGCAVLGDRVYVAPGAVIAGPVTVGDGAAIGANAVVRDDVPPGALAVGVPARVVR